MRHHVNITHLRPHRVGCMNVTFDENAGIRAEQVYRPKPGNSFIDQLADLRLLCDVDAHRESVDFRSDPLRAFAAYIIHDDGLCAFRLESPSQALATAGSSSNDDDDFAFDAHPLHDTPIERFE